MNWIKNSRGLSLIELLATTVLVFIIFMLVFNIVVSSQIQNNEQTKEVKQINDASYVLKVVTKDLRKTETVNISNDDINKYVLVFHKETSLGPLTYEFRNNALYRNNLILANNIENFKIIPSIDNTFIKITFTMNGQNYQASLSYRKGSTP